MMMNWRRNSIGLWRCCCWTKVCLHQCSFEPSFHLRSQRRQQTHCLRLWSLLRLLWARFYVNTDLRGWLESCCFPPCGPRVPSVPPWGRLMRRGEMFGDEWMQCFLFNVCGGGYCSRFCHFFLYFFSLRHSSYQYLQMFNFLGSISAPDSNVSSIFCGHQTRRGSSDRCESLLRFFFSEFLSISGGRCSLQKQLAG